MLRRLFLLVICALWANTLFAQSFVKLLEKRVCVSKGFQETVPIEYIGKFIYLDARLGTDPVPVKFIFDTGAPMVITPALAQRMGYKLLGSVTNTDANATQQQQQYVLIDTLRLGGVVLANVVALVADFNSSAELGCVFGRTEGIFGISALKGLAFQLDYAGQKLTVADRPEGLQPGPGAQSFKYKALPQGSPLVPVLVGGKKAAVVTFDTGSRGGLNLNEDVLEKVITKKHPYKLAVATGASNAGLYGVGRSNRTITQLDGLALGTANLGARLVDFDGLTGGTIGNEVLEDFLVTVNTAARTITLSPNKTLPTGDLRLESFGMALLYKDGQLQIGALYDRSPAKEAGLKLGTAVIMLGGKEIPFLSPADYCQWMD